MMNCQKNNNIWSKVSISIKKGFDSVPVYHEKCLKTKHYEGKINANVYDNGILKEGLHLICP